MDFIFYECVHLLIFRISELCLRNILKMILYHNTPEMAIIHDTYMFENVCWIMVIMFICHQEFT
jgi:hypothetical protein